jgi:hypothetical protein
MRPPPLPPTGAKSDTSSETYQDRFVPDQVDTIEKTWGGLHRDATCGKDSDSNEDPHLTFSL